ncbi:hypothetical protein ACP70R_011345 [Stipagrostis hirtigluma subsp. patula]
MPPPKKPAPAATQAAAPSASLREEETDDGWVLLGAGAGNNTPPKPAPSRGRPPRPPRGGKPSSKATALPAIASGGQPTFDPGPEDLVGRYLPARRALRCGELPPQIHDADVYGAHPAFLASVYPEANGRPEWFFFACRGRGLGGKRRAGPGAYRLAGEARSRGAAGARSYYCHSFRYHEDSAEASAARETEWRMDEYGDDGGAGAAFDMVVCKVYPARGGKLHERLRRDIASRDAKRRADVGGMRPQVLVQLHLAGLSAGDPLRCRVHPVADVCVAHPAVLTAVLPAANDQFEWLFAVRRARSGSGAAPGDDGNARPLRAGAGTYVPAARYWGVRDRRGKELGYRRVFRYREDDDTVRRVSRTEWWMEEYGFGPDFPYGDHRGDEELVVYKVYLKMAGRRR